MCRLCIHTVRPVGCPCIASAITQTDVQYFEAAVNTGELGCNITVKQFCISSRRDLVSFVGEVFNWSSILSKWRGTCICSDVFNMLNSTFKRNIDCCCTQIKANVCNGKISMHVTVKYQEYLMPSWFESNGIFH
jgi:hypothetical protein